MTLRTLALTHVQVTEKDMIDAVNKVIKGYSKFSATPKYLVYN